MSTAWFFLVLALTVAWVLLPLIPAIRELLWPTDAVPLNAVGHDAGALTVFAEGFREYLQRALPAGAASSGAGPGALSDGTAYMQLADSDEPLQSVARSDGVIPCLVMATAPLRTRGGETFLLEVLARRSWEGGPDAVYRALLAEQGATLGERSTVLRWLHVEGDLVVGRESVLDGRASATGVMFLESGVSFRRVGAARIVAGRTPAPLPAVQTPVLNGTTKFPARARRERGFTRIDGDFTVPSGTTVFGSLVVSGRLTVEPHARVGGSLKSHGDCSIGDDCVVDGSVISRGSVEIGRNCSIGGSVVAENNASLGENSSVGSPDSPASISAWSIDVQLGSQVFGAVTARDRARVV